MLIPIHSIIFYFFTTILVASAVMVITAKNPVKAALSLVVTFFSSSVLWMLIQAEFLALVLIFVYVGAVMTLFLFVVMMLRTEARSSFPLRYLPFGLLMFAGLVGVGCTVFSHAHWQYSALLPLPHDASYNNVMSIGTLLFTQYLLPFEVASVMLLVGMISAIALVFHGKKEGTRTQKISEQLLANKRDRLQIMELK